MRTKKEILQVLKEEMEDFLKLIEKIYKHSFGGVS